MSRHAQGLWISALSCGRGDSYGRCMTRSVFVPEDETCFHTFTADSIDAVGTAAELAELSPVRIVEARVRR
jgi:hypothetical protein